MNQNRKSLGIFTLVMINLAAIMSLRNLPAMAHYGLAMIPFYAFVALVFFIPISLISAELASMIPEEGGLYAWVKEAMGDLPAFLCVWLSLVTTVTALTMTMVFLISSTAFAVVPSLAENRWFASGCIIAITWLATLVSLKGMKISGWVTAISSFLGTLLPAVLIIALAVVWVCSGRPSPVVWSLNSLRPNLSQFSNVSFLAGVMFAFAGIEMSAYHVHDVDNPRKTFPRAIFFSAALILVVSVLGSLAIALVIPANEIRLERGVIQSISLMLNGFNLGWLVPLIGGLMAFGGLAYIFAWIAGPSRGLLATRTTGNLPLFLQRTNEREMPSVILFVQAVVVSIFSLLFLFVPSISLGFWILNAASAVMILVLYFFIFLTVVILRYKMPNAVRIYRVPFGNPGLIAICSVGILNLLFCFGISFVLPAEFSGQVSQTTFALLVLGFTVVLSCPPFLFPLFRKPSWNPNGK